MLRITLSQAFLANIQWGASSGSDVQTEHYRFDFEEGAMKMSAFTALDHETVHPSHEQAIERLASTTRR